MKLWRIATETRQFKAQDLSGAGAAKHPGRWNADNEPVVYTAPSIALAVLETAAYINPSGLPLNRFLIEISVPEAVWAARKQLQLADLEPAWAAVPAGPVTVKAGSAWLTSRESALLLVPSVIVPEESCVLINPAHADSAKITAKVLRRFEYGALFRC